MSDRKWECLGCAFTVTAAGVDNIPERCPSCRRRHPWREVAIDGDRYVFGSPEDRLKRVADKYLPEWWYPYHVGSHRDAVGGVRDDDYEHVILVERARGFGRQYVGVVLHEMTISDDGAPCFGPTLDRRLADSLHKAFGHLIDVVDRIERDGYPDTDTDADEDPIEVSE